MHDHDTVEYISWNVDFSANNWFRLSISHLLPNSMLQHLENRSQVYLYEWKYLNVLFNTLHSVKWYAALALVERDVGKLVKNGSGKNGSGETENIRYYILYMLCGWNIVADKHIWLPSNRQLYGVRHNEFCKSIAWNYTPKQEMPNKANERERGRER